MKGKNLIVLVAVASALAAVAVYTSKGNRHQPPAVIGKTVFKDLPVNDVEKIIISKAKDSVTISKLNDTWVCNSKYNYPVKFDRIKESLIKLADIKIGQTVPVNDNQRAEIKMIKPDADNSGTLIELFNKDARSLASLLIGESRQGGAQPEMGFGGGYPDGQFVSSDLGKTVYLISDSLNHITEQPRGWLETELLNVPAEDITRISIGTKSSKPLVFSKDDKGELTMEGLSQKEECDSSKLSSLKSALSYLNFDDVADPSLNDKQLGMDDPITYQAETKKGALYTVMIGKSPEQNASKFVRINVALKEMAPEVQEKTKATSTEMTEEEKKAADEKKKKTQDERKALEEEVLSLNAKLSNWTYMVAIYKTDNMVCAREEIVKAKSDKDDKKE